MTDIIAIATTTHNDDDTVSRAIQDMIQGGPAVEITIGKERHIVSKWRMVKGDNGYTLVVDWERRADRIERLRIPLRHLAKMPWRTALAVIRRRMVKWA